MLHSSPHSTGIKNILVPWNQTVTTWVYMVRSFPYELVIHKGFFFCWRWGEIWLALLAEYDWVQILFRTELRNPGWDAYFLKDWPGIVLDIPMEGIENPQDESIDTIPIHIEHWGVHSSVLIRTILEQIGKDSRLKSGLIKRDVEWYNALINLANSWRNAIKIKDNSHEAAMNVIT